MSRPPSLTVVADADVKSTPKTETVAERIQRLQREARALAKDQVRALLASMAQTEALAREIAEGGSAFHAGAQERARRIAMELGSQRETLEAIVSRTL